MRELRLRRGLQQREVARRLEISPAYLSLIEKGRRVVQLPLLFHPNPEKVLNIGFGSGVTAGAVASHDDVELIDVRELELPFCDGAACYSHPSVVRLQKAVAGASAITIATPMF